ncbi:MAG: DUF488 domain-containing protein [Chlorobi bacterium]|nr:MAG: hypothetical protein UZ06_CHB003000845 [Chlorobi bacterium OLB6]MBL1161841.1 DUF488 domain-containing protein [Chlorobiota bacterium]MBW7853506.1 DUF488 domain-containing protein [Candidatus Kapabacteria bacterium]MCC6331571.1 DUF488 domain-containing protein [Ignavibacteria bacterium]MCL4277588.1 DUF488 domain-containing protein [Ignavibacteria bacterium]
MSSALHHCGTVFTIGHSTRSLAQFTELLTVHSVQVLADVRRFPYSRKYPHFNTDVLRNSLAESNIVYRHYPGLGGRRRPNPDSRNTAWRNASFRGYADYMETAVFQTAIQEFQEDALRRVCAVMCSEAVWWRCHRALIADFLTARGWQVLHILSSSTVEEHSYTEPARIENNRVVYTPSP